MREGVAMFHRQVDVLFNELHGGVAIKCAVDLSNGPLVERPLEPEIGITLIASVAHIGAEQSANHLLFLPALVSSARFIKPLMTKNISTPMKP